MKTYKYKTLKGFLSNCSPACGYVRASLLFGGGRGAIPPTAQSKPAGGRKIGKNRYLFNCVRL
jgi:hypothetical protein